MWRVKNLAAAKVTVGLSDFQYWNAQTEKWVDDARGPFEKSRMCTLKVRNATTTTICAGR